MVLPTGRVECDPSGGRILTFGLRLNWYRALPVSCVERLQVAVDGETLSPQDVVVRLGRVESGPDRLVAHDDDWWAVGQIAEVSCLLPERAPAAEYRVTVDLGTRVPYMPPPPGAAWRLVTDTCTRTVSTLVAS